MANWQKPSFNNNDHSSEPYSFSMADAEERGSRLGEMVRQVPQEVVDIFFGRYTLTLAESVELTRAIEIRNAASAILMNQGVILRNELARLQASDQEQNQRRQVIIRQIHDVQKPAADHQGVNVQEDQRETTQVVVPETKAANKQVQEEDQRETTEEVPEIAANQGKGDQEERETSQVPDQIVVTEALNEVDGENKVQEKAAHQEGETSKVEETAAKEEVINEEDHTETTTEMTAGKVIEEEKKNEVITETGSAAEKEEGNNQEERETSTIDQEDQELAARLNKMSREERIEWDKKKIIHHFLSSVKMPPSNKSSYPFLN